VEERELEAARLLAGGLIDAGRFEAARDVLAGLIAADPGDLFARRNLVRVRLALGDYAAAEPEARMLAERASGPDRAPARFFHANALWGAGRIDECRREVELYARELAALGGAPETEKAE
jgi:thioredoxin-like negative regulator of GroEL